MADTTEFADRVSAYVANMTPEEFASFTASVRPPDETTPAILGTLPDHDDTGRGYPNEWEIR